MYSATKREKHIGIVLKNNIVHIDNSMAIFDQHYGRIFAHSRNTAMPSSSIIHYNLAQRRNNKYYQLLEIELIAIPLHIAHEDLLFLHHLLELCYYFLPGTNNNSEIFNLLTEIFAHYQQEILFKKSVICKLLALFGAYPDGQQWQNCLFYRLGLGSIDTIMQKVLQSSIEKEFSQWLYACVCGHPYAHCFKTKHFLTKENLKNL